MIMATYLESGIFYCKYLQGMGSLIVPSCGPAKLREFPWSSYEDQAGVFDTSAQNCPPSKLYLCPPNCAARITNVTWRASPIFLGFQIMLFICFRRLAKSPELLSNKEQIKSRDAKSSPKCCYFISIYFNGLDQLGSNQFAAVWRCDGGKVWRWLLS